MNQNILNHSLIVLASQLAHKRTLFESSHPHDESQMYVGDLLEDDKRYTDAIQDTFDQWLEYYSNEINNIFKTN